MMASDDEYIREAAHILSKALNDRLPATAEALHPGFGEPNMLEETVAVAAFAVLLRKGDEG